MWDVSFELINGMMLGIEFPTFVALTEEGFDDDAPTPFVIQLDILIIRISLFKF